MQARGPHRENWCCKGLYNVGKRASKTAQTKLLSPRVGRSKWGRRSLHLPRLLAPHSLDVRATTASQRSSASHDTHALRSLWQTRHAVARKLAIDRTFCASGGSRFGPICARVGIHLFSLSLGPQQISRSLLHRLGHNFIKHETGQCSTTFTKRVTLQLAGTR